MTQRTYTIPGPGGYPGGHPSVGSEPRPELAWGLREGVAQVFVVMLTSAFKAVPPQINSWYRWSGIGGRRIQ